MSTTDQAKIGENQPARDRHRNHRAKPPTSWAIVWRCNFRCWTWVLRWRKFALSCIELFVVNQQQTWTQFLCARKHFVSLTLNASSLTASVLASSAKRCSASDTTGQSLNYVQWMMCSCLSCVGGGYTCVKSVSEVRAFQNSDDAQ